MAIGLIIRGAIMTTTGLFKVASKLWRTSPIFRRFVLYVGGWKIFVASLSLVWDIITTRAKAGTLWSAAAVEAELLAMATWVLANRPDPATALEQYSTKG